jgi:hypothetical protein
MFGGGEVQCSDPQNALLPRLFAQLLSWLPDKERLAPRSIRITARAASAAKRPPAQQNLVHYLAAAWLYSGAHGGDPLLANRAWRLVLDLARTSDLPLTRLFEELTALASHWDKSERLAAHLERTGLLDKATLRECDAKAPAPLIAGAADAGRLWNRILHYWGRGFLAPGRERFARAAAKTLAMRIAADHLFAIDDSGGGDPYRYLRRLRYESILTRARVEELSLEVRRAIPSLQMPEDLH